MKSFDTKNIVLENILNGSQVWGGYEFFMFYKEVSSSHEGCIYLQKYSKNSEIVKYYYNSK